MKNKEKYAKEIVDIATEGWRFALNKDEKIVSCTNIRCSDCLFNAGRGCIFERIAWANAEYKESKQFSKADKAYVKAMDKLNWFVRDKDGSVWGFVNKPFKKCGYWYADSTKFVLFKSFASSATFEPLSWEDEEPTHRSEILGVK